MADMRWSVHALARMLERLASLVSPEEVQAKVAVHAYPVGETWVVVKRFPREVVVVDDRGTVVNGDVVYAVVRRTSEADVGSIATVMLRRAKQGTKGREVRE